MHEILDLVKNKLKLRGEIPALAGKAPLSSKYQRTKKKQSDRQLHIAVLQSSHFEFAQKGTNYYYSPVKL